MPYIDAHLHFPIDHPDAVAVLEDLDLRLLNICVSHKPDWQSQRARYRSMHQSRPDRFAWCTSFDMPTEADFANPGRYAQSVIAELEKDLRDGAAACKIWKNVGMELRKPDGSFLMPDDPIFAPILAYLAKQDSTLLCHIGEPLACWRPLVDDNPHYGYYSNHPEWHMHGRDDFPSHGDLIDARDRMVGAHPDLRVVGAHFGSLEFDVREVAKRLDRFPNFAVDTSARLADLTYQDVAVVRDFFNRYSDRILWGTDIVVGNLDATEQADEETLRKRITSSRDRWSMELHYYSSAEQQEIRGRMVPGLGLAGDVQQKVFTGNTLRWYPALAG